MTLTCDPLTPPQIDNCLRIARSLTAADGLIIATGDVFVDGDLHAGSAIRAGGIVHISNGVQTATVVSAVAVKSLQGSIIGGTITAGQQISCRCAGDSSSTPTTLSVGWNDTFIEQTEKRVAQIKATRQKSAGFRASLEPMLKGARELSAAQKEQVTELMFSVQSAEKRAEAATQELKKRLIEANNFEDAKIVVSERIYPGVTIYFPELAAEILSPLQGPVEITRQGSGDAQIIVARSLRTGTVTELKTTSYCCKLQLLLKELEGQ